MRVYEFSRKINIPSSEILSVLREKGFAVKSHMSILSDDAISFLTEKFVTKESKEKKAATKKQPEKKEDKKVQIQPQIKKIEKKTHRALQKEEEKIEKVPSEIVLEPMTVGSFADRIDKSVNDIILTLLKWGVVAAKNQTLDEDMVVKLASHYEITTKKPQVIKKEIIKEVATSTEGLEARLPIVVVLGHVDHGKTTLLDYIRKTRVTAKEKGGITQHIGAYEAKSPHGSIVFLDTPGHEAFPKIRQRGARIADIAILVIAADDGIMPQTLEAIRHAKESNLPIVVGINKIDKVEASQIESVKRQLADHDLLPEEWGGQTICVPISAKEGTNIDQLLEMLLLQSQIMELRASKKGPGKGYVLESKFEKGRGPVATIILQHGSVAIGDFFVCGNTVGRINSLFDSFGKRVKTVGPSIPVQISGFESLPDAGDFFEVVPKESYLSARKKLEQTKTQRLKKEGAINIIVKADTNSTKEALSDAIEILSKKAETSFNIVETSVGDINESDVELAFNTNSGLIGLHVKVEPNAATLAQRKHVSIKLFDIIYKLLEALEKRLESEKEVELVRKKIGEAIVRRVFDIKGIGVIAGCYIKDGRFTKDGFVVGWRGDIKIGEGKIKSLQREKKTVKEVHSGFECGFVVEGMTDWQPDDRAECFIDVPVTEK